MAIALILVGSELLHGKRQDRHLAHVIQVLARRALALAQVTVVGDEAARLTAILRRSLASADLVFCFGGIGSTPDDLTRQCAAAAAGVGLVRHPGAVAEIEAQFGVEAYPLRVRMADLPEGCSLIPNPYNRIPGFSLADHHFLPGFPQMAWPMLEWVLDTHYPELAGPPVLERGVRVLDWRESELVPLQEALIAHHPGIQLSSLPHLGEAARWVDLGIRGSPELVCAAYLELLERLRGLQVNYQPLD
jgi:molybdopterin-biosynthesis enzyme MoeA-like protein